MKREAWRTIAIVALVSMIVLVITQWAFRTEALAPFLVAEWTAGEFLDYMGGIIGAAATIEAVRMTIMFEREERLEDQRLNVLPFIAITLLERHVPRTDLFSDSANSSNKDKDQGLVDSYTEYSAEKVYVVINKLGEINYTSRLSENQAHLAQGGSFVIEKISDELFTEVRNKSLYYPLVLCSTGNGPAINVSVRLQKDGQGPKLDTTGVFLHLPTVQLTIGESQYVGILFEDWSAEDAIGHYELVIAYYDVLGHRYQQRHELALMVSEGEACNSVFSKFDLKINQERLL